MFGSFYRKKRVELNYSVTVTCCHYLYVLSVRFYHFVSWIDCHSTMLLLIDNVPPPECRALTDGKRQQMIKSEQVSQPWSAYWTHSHLLSPRVIGVVFHRWGVNTACAVSTPSKYLLSKLAVWLSIHPGSNDSRRVVIERSGTHQKLTKGKKTIADHECK